MASKGWYKRNHERAREYHNRYAAQRRLRALASLGGCCRRCGETDPVVLDFDHVNDDGYKEGRKRTKIVYVVERNPERFQILCKNCNWRKEIERRCRARAQPKLS